VKILVVSDTHGAIIESVVNPLKAEENVDVLIHCGDKYRDAEKLSQMLRIKRMFRVPGNCDFDFGNKEKILLLDIEGKHLMITHGHIHHVKDGLERLKQYAAEKKVDAVLFGHTHIAHDEVDRGILYFNPGSTILPKFGSASYGILNVTKDGIESRIVNL
jgi:putative phosphoesterase